ncbi:MAG TPA: hypothetical protein VG477_06890 [Thermoanaerobaculia bacterium]|nr:hypothetical protein [Thermoanaerobaculia bacterium]
MDLHFWVRNMAYQKEGLPAVEGLAPAVEAVRRMNAELKDSWGLYDGAFVGLSSVEDLAKSAAELPESLTLRNGQMVRPREGVARLAAAYRPLEKPFLEKIWPGHRELAEKGEALLRATLLPRSSEVFSDLSRHLGTQPPSSPIPVYLVASAPFPRAVTFRSEGKGVCVIALIDETPILAAEIAIHESIHALDVAAGETSVFADLRRRLLKVPGASPQDIHDFVHTVMFVQGAATVRRIFDPAHKDYGDTSAYYPKVPRASAVVVPAWKDYNDGKITREAAVERIVSGFGEKEKGGPKAAPEKPSGSGPVR